MEGALLIRCGLLDERQGALSLPEIKKDLLQEAVGVGFRGTTPSMSFTHLLPIDRDVEAPLIHARLTARPKEGGALGPFRGVPGHDQIQPQPRWTVSMGSILSSGWPQLGHWRVHIPAPPLEVPGYGRGEQTAGQASLMDQRRRSARACSGRQTRRHGRESSGMHRTAQCGWAACFKGWPPGGGGLLVGSGRSPARSRRTGTALASETTGGPPMRLARLAARATLALALLATPLAVEAQPTGKAYRVGHVMLGTRDQNAVVLQALDDGLRRLGHARRAESPVRAPIRRRPGRAPGCPGGGARPAERRCDRGGEQPDRRPRQAGDDDHPDHHDGRGGGRFWPARCFHSSVVSPTGFAGLWKQEFQGLIKIA